MSAYIIRRLLTAVPILAGLSLLIFTLSVLSPSSPAAVLARQRSQTGQITPADIQQARDELGLDRPLTVRYLDWVQGALHGDLGRSFFRDEPVLQLILDRLPATLQLTGAALLLSIVLSLPLGVIAALQHRRIGDHVLRIGALIFASIPGFVFAFVLIIVFATKLDLLPVAGRQGPASVVLPALAIAVGPTAILSRLLRSTLLEVFSEEYMKAAGSKGLPQLWVVTRHALRNAAIPVVTVLGPVLAFLIDGTLVVEIIFAWPGLGRLTFEAISQRDYPVIMAMVLYAGAAFLVVNLLVDISYAALDPRVRLRSSS